MKWIWSILICGAACAAVAAPEARPFADYQVILDRKPFGAPPDRSLEPERVVPVSESFAASLLLSNLYELDDGNLRAAFVDRKDNSFFALVVGETSDSGIELLDVDYDRGTAVLKKGEETVELSLGGGDTGQVLSAAQAQDRQKQAAERRMSYAERRRQRMLERQKTPEAQQPLLTGEALEQHLQDYQMEVIRQGMPPLPVQLSPERDAQLVAEGFLPPVDEEGYEIAPEEEYYEEGE